MSSDAELEHYDIEVQERLSQGDGRETRTQRKKDPQLSRAQLAQLPEKTGGYWLTVL